MTNSVKIAITLPDYLYARVEEGRRRAGISRSAFIQHALGVAFAEMRKREKIGRYKRLYRMHPETRRDVEAALAAAAELIAREPWA